MKTLAFLLIAVSLLSGCNKKPKEVEWGVFNEPVKSVALPATADVNEINVIWEQDIGNAGDDGYAILRPGVTEDAVYVSNRSGLVRKLWLDSGKQQWQYDIDRNTFAGVGVGEGEGIAVVALDNGSVLALDAETGEKQWVSSVNRQISAVPAVGAGRVVLRTSDGAVLGLDANTGTEVWKVERDSPGLSVHGDSSPLISADAVVTGLSSGKLMANSVVNGRDFWEIDISYGTGTNELERLADIDGQPLLIGSSLYAATYQGDVVLLDISAASILWRQQISTRLSMSISGDQLYVTDSKGGVSALHSDSGEILWSQQGLQGRGISNPVAQGNRVVVGDAKGNIHLLDASGGSFLQTQRIARGAIVNLVASANGLVAFSARGAVVNFSINQD